MIEDLRLAYPLPLILDRNVDRLLSYPGSPAGLDSGAVPPDLLAALNAVGISISTASVWAVTPGWQWVITDFSTGLNYAVVKEDAEA